MKMGYGYLFSGLIKKLFQQRSRRGGIKQWDTLKSSLRMEAGRAVLMQHITGTLLNEGRLQKAKQATYTTFICVRFVFCILLKRTPRLLCLFSRCRVRAISRVYFALGVRITYTKV